MQDLYVGFDVGNRNSMVFALTREGEIVLDGKRFRTLDEEQWRAILDPLRKCYRLRAAFEIGPHYEWLYDLLREYCFEVVVVNASAFGIINKSHKKTDKIDAQKLAEGLLRGDLPDVFVPDKQARADRRLISLVHYSSRELVSVRVRLRGLLLTYRLECPYRDILGVKARKWLADVAQPALDDLGKMTLRMLLELADVLLRQRAELDAVVKKALEHYADASLVRSVPGFGPLTTLAVLCAVADITRFGSPGELCSYLGVCGRVQQSGQSLRLGPMTKRGNSHVRWLLAQALLHLHKKDLRARQRYQRLKKKKPRGVARGAMMRWLASVLWHVWSKRTAYEINRKAQKPKAA